MGNRMDEAVEVVQQMRGAHVRLPPRGGAGARGVGIGLIVFGLFFVAFMILWVKSPLLGLFSEKSPMRWFNLIFVAFSLPGFAAGLAMLIGGSALLTGRMRTEIRVDQSVIAVTERAGFLRWTRRRRFEGALRFVILKETAARSGGTAERSQNPIPTLALETGAAPWIVTVGYSADIFREAVARIAALVPSAIAGDGSGAPVVVEIRDEAAGSDPDAPDHALPQPPGSKAILQPVSDGFGITFPPPGLIKGSAGLFVFGVIWTVMSLAIASIAAFGDEKGAVWGPLAFTSIFVAIGIGMICAAVHFGRRKTVLLAVGGQVAVKFISPLRTTQWVVNGADIVDIRVAPSGVEVNDQPVLHVQILTAAGKKHGLLGGRQVEEMRWVASLLRQRCRIGGAAAPDGRTGG